MYGKIFEAIYDGTLADHWQALVTFEQMIVLCDADGVLDKTPEALARRTGIPLEIFLAGIPILEQPDRRSKSPAEEGRRIVRLDPHRDWGWKLVNHEYYKGLQDAEEVREQNRLRQQRRRDRLKEAGEKPEEPGEQGDLLDGEELSDASRSVTLRHAKSRHTDTHTDTRKDNIRPADRLFDLWKTTYNHPRAKLDAKREGKIRAALKLGYSVTELEHAIQGYKYSPHHMGKNETGTVYDDIELFLRDAKHIDKGIQLWESRPKEHETGADPRQLGVNRGVHY